MRPHSATDADTLIAYALLRYAGADQAALHRDGRRVADAVLSQESVTLPDGAPLPVAGPWAKATGTVDPSYLMPSVFAGLAGLTGDDRWNRAAAAAVAQIATLTNGGRLLPPDWARLSGSRLVPIANPGGGAGVQYSFDAARLPIWFAAACTADARGLAAGWWRDLLGADGRSGPQALSLDGATINAAPSPLPLMAGSAAAAAAGDRQRGRRATHPRHHARPPGSDLLRRRLGRARPSSARGLDHPLLASAGLIWLTTGPARARG